MLGPSRARRASSWLATDSIECFALRLSYGTRLLRDGDRLPSTGLRGLKDRVGHVIGGEAVAERRRRALACRGGVEEIGELVDERVLVADLQAGHPPVLHIRMIAVGDVDAAPAAQLPLVSMVEPLEPVEIVEIPSRRGVLAVDLERVERLVPARVPRRLEERERSVLEACE